MFELITIFGAKYLIFGSLLLVGAYLLQSSPETRKKLLIFLLISLPLTYLAGLAARQAYFNPRPFVVGGFTPLLSHTADNGFPSDHILLAAALASALFFFNRRYAYGLWGIAIFVALARVYAGVHHPLDVIASMGIALLCAIIISKSYAREQ